MGNEGISERHQRHVKAMGLFEREMDALMPPVTRDELMEATKRLLIGMFDFSAKESSTRTNILAKNYDIPGDYELENFPESLPEILKLGLLDRLCEEYVVLFGKEQFDKWIGIFMRSVLKGHIEESASLEHYNECPERFCPARIVTRFMDDRLRGNKASIDKNEVYLVYPDEIIHMNIKIVKLLESFGIYTPVESENLLDDYRWWLESIDDAQVNFDRSAFETS